jgi:hypothetical protein
MAVQMPSQFLGAQHVHDLQNSKVLTKKRETGHTHKAPITIIRLCPISVTKTRNFTDKSYQFGPLDLLVGDEQGFVSRWSLLKLDQLSQNELTNVSGLRIPPSRDLDTSATATLVGAASAFGVPLGAAGLLKILSTGVMVGGHQHQSNSHGSHHNHHETASALAAKIQEIEDLSNDDNTEEFF